MNNLSIIGRVGKDPELKYFESGKVVANFSIAVNQIGVDEPLWFDVAVWGKQAQVCADWIKKGRQVGLQGEVGLKQFTSTQTGEVVTRLTINVQRVTLCGAKNEGVNDSPARTPAPAGSPQWNTRPQNSSSDDDDIPF